MNLQRPGQWCWEAGKLCQVEDWNHLHGSLKTTKDSSSGSPTHCSSGMFLKWGPNLFFPKYFALHCPFDMSYSVSLVVLTLFNCCRGPLCASLLVKSCRRTLKLVFTFLCIQSISIIPPQTWITNMHIHDTVYMHYKSFFKASHLRAKNGFPVRDTIQLSHKALHKKQNTTKHIIFIEYSNKSLSNLGLNWKKWDMQIHEYHLSYIIF